jgi:DNA invertase Pin-like site-specific DNA recombinase
MKTAISYTRFSTPEQAKGHSYERQTKAAQKFCDSNGLILVEQLKDLGISGWSGKNLDDTAALGGFLKLVQTGKIPKSTVLIIENLDRLTRANPLNAINLFTDIIKAGIEIVTTQDNKWYSESSLKKNAMELMSSILLFSRGHEESETKSKRIRASWDSRYAKVQKGEFAKIRHPYWLSCNNQKYELIPERVKTIKLIFELYLKGFGAYNLVKELTKRDVAPFNRKAKWTVKFLHNLLQSPAVIGTCDAVNPPRENYYPAVVSTDIFYKALAQRKQNLNHKGRTGSLEVNIYGGICKCHKCGSNMVKYVCGKGEKKRNYLVCSNSKQGICKYELVPFDRFNDVFLHVLNSFQFTSLLFTKEAPIDNSDAIRGKMIELEKTIDRVADAIVETDNSEALIIRLKKLQSQKALLKDEYDIELGKKAGEAFSKKDYQTFLHGYEPKLKNKSFRLALRALIRRYISQIICGPDYFNICLTNDNDLVSVTLNKPKLTPFGIAPSYSLDFGKWNPDETPAPIIPLLPVKKIPNKSLTKSVLKAKGILHMN